MTDATGQEGVGLWSGYQRRRQLVYEIFAPNKGGRLGYWVDWGIMILIITNVTAVILATVAPIERAAASFFYWFELFSVAVFTIEYVARVWSAVDNSAVDGGSVLGRVKFMAKPLLIVDLLAILPFYLSALGAGVDLRVLRALRLTRLLRLVKLARYSQSIRSLKTVLRDKRPDLVIAMFANTLLLVVASSAMYFIEQDAQPDAFSSIPEAMWWGVATLTTVGYGDVAPITPLGQFVGAFVAVLGIGLFALPASILASGFIDAAGSQERREYCPNCGERVSEE
jgi:voltage-gated potassium channel